MMTTLANNASTVHLLHASAAIARTSCPTLQPLSGVNASNQQRESLAVRIDRACWICRLDLRAGGRRTRVCASECARVAQSLGTATSNPADAILSAASMISSIPAPTAWVKPLYDRI
jgi:hypothetical protein